MSKLSAPIEYPRHAPPHGVCVPVVYERLRDGDTVVVRLPGGSRKLAVRLLGCWAPESHDKQRYEIVAAGKRFLHDALSAADEGDLRLFVPFGELADVSKVSPFDLFTFDRVLGWLFVGSQTVSEMMVRRGFAASTKDRELGT